MPPRLEPHRPKKVRFSLPRDSPDKNEQPPGNRYIVEYIGPYAGRKNTYFLAKEMLIHMRCNLLEALHMIDAECKNIVNVLSVRTLFELLEYDIHLVHSIAWDSAKGLLNKLIDCDARHPHQQLKKLCQPRYERISHSEKRNSSENERDLDSFVRHILGGAGPRTDLKLLPVSRNSGDNSETKEKVRREKVAFNLGLGVARHDPERWKHMVLTTLTSMPLQPPQFRDPLPLPRLLLPPLPPLSPYSLQALPPLSLRSPRSPYSLQLYQPKLQSHPYHNNPNRHPSSSIHSPAYAPKFNAPPQTKIPLYTEYRKTDADSESDVGFPTPNAQPPLTTVIDMISKNKPDGVVDTTHTNIASGMHPPKSVDDKTEPSLPTANSGKPDANTTDQSSSATPSKGATSPPTASTPVSSTMEYERHVSTLEAENENFNSTSSLVAKTSYSLEKLSGLVNVLSTCSRVRDALVTVRKCDLAFDGVPPDSHGGFFSLKKIQDHGAMARSSGDLRDTTAGPEFDLLKWSSPGWPVSGLGKMEGHEAMETLAMKADYTKYEHLEEELETLSSVEDVEGTIYVRSEKEVSLNTIVILIGLLFGKKADCSSSFISWIYKAQITVASVQFPPGVPRALLLRASQATRIQYYAPDVSLGLSAAPFLIRRFHYELRRRFDYRRSSCEYERDPISVCETVCDALCYEHMEKTELVEPLLAVLYMRRGDCAMQGTSEKGKRSLPCVLCLYGTGIPGRVKNPMIYSNVFIESGGTIEDDLKTIYGNEVKPDYCDRWSFKLLSLLFSGNWNAMECAIYNSKEPVIAGKKLRDVVKKLIKGETSVAIKEGITPWVVFEVCQSYRLNTSKFIQRMYDCSVELANAGNKKVLNGGVKKVLNTGDDKVLKQVDRILGGIASIYDYRKLMSGDPHDITVGSEQGGITGCLYLYNAMEDNTFAERYIFHRWLMERAYKKIKSQNDIRAVEYWCSMYAIGVKRTGERLTFVKGPFVLTGTLQQREAGFYHYHVDQSMDVLEVGHIDVYQPPAVENVTFICDDCG